MIAINKLILLVIFLVILLATLIILFSGSPVIEQLNLQSELRGCCQIYRSYGCPENLVELSNINCEKHTLAEIVIALNMKDDISKLKKFCNCPNI